jgi:hypothetical protein
MVHVHGMGQPLCSMIPAPAAVKFSVFLPSFSPSGMEETQVLDICG